MKNGAFAYFMHLIGAFAGKKTTQARKLPDWIIKGNNRIVREFLGGLFGGDGCKTSAQNSQYGGHKIRMGSLNQTTIGTYLNQTIDYMKSISNLLCQFRIQSKVTHTHNKDKENKYQVCIDISNANENLAKFTNIIGYRYCYEKRKNSAVPIEYLKCKDHIIKTKMQKYNELMEFMKSPNKTCTISQKIKNLGLDHRTSYKIITRYKGNG